MIINYNNNNISSIICIIFLYIKLFFFNIVKGLNAGMRNIEILKCINDYEKAVIEKEKGRVMYSYYR
jgi:hypothetical protein